MGFLPRVPSGEALFLSYNSSERRTRTVMKCHVISKIKTGIKLFIETEEDLRDSKQAYILWLPSPFFFKEGISETIYVFFIECLSYSQWVLFLPPNSILFSTSVQNWNCDPSSALALYALVLCPLIHIPALSPAWCFPSVQKGSLLLPCFRQHQCLCIFICHPPCGFSGDFWEGQRMFFTLKPLSELVHIKIVS